MKQHPTEEVEYEQLNSSQAGVLTMQLLNPSSPIYNLTGTSIGNEEVRLDILEESIVHFVHAVKTINIRVKPYGDTWVQYVEKTSVQNFEIVDFGQCVDPKTSFQDWVRNEGESVFSLENDVLYTFKLLRVPTVGHGFFFKVHHLIADGWSLSAMVNEIWTIYEKLVNPDSNVLKDTSLVHREQWKMLKDYVDRERKYHHSRRFVRDREFWLEYFDDVKYSKYQVAPVTSKRATFDIPVHTRRKLKELSTRLEVSVYDVFLSAVLLVMSSTNGLDGPLYGVPVSNRFGESKWFFGMVSNLMPFKHDISIDDPLYLFVKKVARNMSRCLLHQKYPYDVILHDLSTTGITTGYDIVVNYYTANLIPEVHNTAIETREYHSGQQQYTMQFVMRDWNYKSNLDIDFDCHKYSEQYIATISRMFIKCIDKLDASPDSLVSELLITENEKQYETITPKLSYKSVVDLFIDQTKKTPDATAIVQRQTNLTFKQLYNQVLALTTTLITLGIGNGDVVAIVMNSSIEALVSILATLKVGAIFVPIDPEYPIERIRYCIGDARSKLILTKSNTMKIDGVEVVQHVVELQSADTLNGIDEVIEVASEPEKAAYIMYTSGSTGFPKGVLVEHGSLLNYVLWAKDTYILGQAEAFPLYSSIAFDLTLTSIFVPIVSGAKIIVYESEAGIHPIERIIDEGKANVVKVTPAHLSLLLSRADRSNSPDMVFRTFIVGGEELKPDLCRRITEYFHGKIRIFNEYGPTETVVGCMCHQYDFDKDRNTVPIGRPIYNTHVYLLNDSGSPVKNGDVGEIYISGDGVARGYIGLPKESRERFLSDPFRTGCIMYRTGDLAQRNQFDEFVYVGRGDSQVKVKGHRIELREIEQCLMLHPSVCDSIAMKHSSSVDEIVAYVLIEGTATCNTNELLAHCRRFLPYFMIPHNIVSLSSWPLTVNGKVDKESLPPVTEDNWENEMPSAIVDAVLGVYQDVLNNRLIRPSDNFYSAGGDSIKALRIAGKLSQLGFDVQPNDILAFPSVNLVTPWVGMTPKLNPARNASGTISLSPIMHWFFLECYQYSSVYNQSLCLELEREVSLLKLNEAFDVLIKRHDSLRLNFRIERGVPVGYYNSLHLESSYKVQFYDLSGLSRELQDERFEEICARTRRFESLSNALLFRVAVFYFGAEQKQRIFITAHHLVIDGVSWLIILDDFIELLDSGHIEPHNTNVASYGEWTDQVFRKAKESPCQLEQWIKVASAQSGSKFICNSVLEGVKYLYRSINLDDDTEMVYANSMFGTNSQDLYITALARTIHAFLGLDDFVIDIEGHGRGGARGLYIDSTVGWFTSIYPVSLKISELDIGRQIISVKELLRNIPDNDQYYGALKYIGDKKWEESGARMRFNLVTGFESSRWSNWFTIKPPNLALDMSINQMRTPVEITIVQIGRTINMYVRYISSLDDVDRFIEQYDQEIQQVLNYCCNQRSPYFTPSDFDTVTLSQSEIDELVND